MWRILFSYFLLCNLSSNGGETARMGRSRNACAELGSECRCKRGKHNEQNIICTKQNCMKRLPTREVPKEQAGKVVSLLVTKQRNLTTIGQTELRRLGNITEIRITRCNVSQVSPYAFMGLNHVRTLDLHKNNLDGIPPAIKQLANLEYLNLGGNKIQHFQHAALFSLRKLKRLILGRNFLVSIPSMLPPSLIKLTVSGNQLTELGDLEYLRNLRILLADKNNLTAIPQLPSTVKVVSLCTNQIDEDVSLLSLPNLTSINLSNNKRIGDISMMTFSNQSGRLPPRKLRKFVARNSGIRSITPNAFNCLSRLRVLDLSYNEIRSYRESWFSGNKAMRSVQIRGNPFSCGCDVNSSLAEIADVFRMTNEVKKREFHNDFHLVTCETSVVEREPCEKFTLTTDSCSIRAYEKDEMDRTTTTTTTTTLKPTTASTTTATTSTTTTTKHRRPLSTNAFDVTTRPVFNIDLMTELYTVRMPQPRPVTSSFRGTMARNRIVTTPDVRTKTRTTTMAAARGIKSTTTTTSTATIGTMTLAAARDIKSTTTTEPTTTKTTTRTTTTPVSTTTTSSTTTTTTTTTATTTTLPATEPPTTNISTTLRATQPKTTQSSTTARPTTKLPTTTHSSTLRQSTTTTSSPTTTSSTLVIPSVGPVGDLEEASESKKWCSDDSVTPCIFPFIYNSEKVYECVGWRKWCSETDNYDRDGEWGYCQEC